MAGVKGKSGRKTTTEENKRLRIIDKGWDIIEKALDDKTLKAADRIKIALELCKKNIPQELEHTGAGNTYFFTHIDNNKERPVGDLIRDLNAALSAQFQRE